MLALSDIVRFANELLCVTNIEDYPNALNGLQIENNGEVKKLGAAVDASSATFQMAIEREIDFLLVHHGLFWPGLQPVVGAFFRAQKLALTNNLALYSAHLPLDFHPRLGNNALLAASLGWEKTEPFMKIKNQFLGLCTDTSVRRDAFITQLENSLGANVRCIGAGPIEMRRIGLVTGGAGGEIYQAAREEVDSFVTGEAPHWAAVAAEELGVNLFLGGHYATETFGVKALAAELAQRFDLPWEFLNHPSGL